MHHDLSQAFKFLSIRTFPELTQRKCRNLTYEVNPTVPEQVNPLFQVMKPGMVHLVEYPFAVPLFHQMRGAIQKQFQLKDR